MENWIRIFEFNSDQVLAHKEDKDDSGSESPFHIKVVLNINGNLNTATLGYVDAVDRDEAFDNLSERRIRNIYEGIMHLHN